MHQFFWHRDLSLLLIDLDPQFNLTQTLIAPDAYEGYRRENRTIFTAMEPPPRVHLLDVNVTDVPPPSAWDLSPRLKTYDDTSFIDIMPGDFELVKYSLIADTHKLDQVQARFLRFINEAKNHYDLIAIDCNPSSSFITQCALHACDHVLVPVRAETYSLLGLKLLSRYIQEMPTLHPKPDISVLINKSPHPGVTEQTEQQLRADAEISPWVLDNGLPYSLVLAARPNQFGFFMDQRRQTRRYVVGRQMNPIVDELCVRWGL